MYSIVGATRHAQEREEVRSPDYQLKFEAPSAHPSKPCAWPPAAYPRGSRDRISSTGPLAGHQPFPYC